MRLTLAVLLCGLIVAFTPGPATADEEAPGDLVLIGDSFLGGSLSDPTRWYNRVASHAQLTLHRLSSAGSGMLKAGHHCAPQGKTFGQRLGAITELRPEVVIVEDGINDLYYCRKGRYLVASRAQARSNIDSFMRKLAISAQKGGVERRKVYVVFPTSYQVRRYTWVLDYAQKASARHGFTYLAPYLTVNETTDGFHPNAKGQDRMAKTLIEAMG